MSAFAPDDFNQQVPALVGLNAGLPPKRAPRTLTVHDRKIAVDCLPPEPSMYLLAREWMANNPHKPIYVRPNTLPPGGGVQLPPPLPPTVLSSARLKKHPRKRGAAAAGLEANGKTSEGASMDESDEGTDEPEFSRSRASTELILAHHVEHARDVRRWFKVQRQAVLDRYRYATLP
jgi:hypothetical protein